MEKKIEPSEPVKSNQHYLLKIKNEFDAFKIWCKSWEESLGLIQHFLSNGFEVTVKKKA